MPYVCVCMYVIYAICCVYMYILYGIKIII